MQRILFRFAVEFVAPLHRVPRGGRQLSVRDRSRVVVVEGEVGDVVVSTRVVKLVHAHIDLHALLRHSSYLVYFRIEIRRGDERRFLFGLATLDEIRGSVPFKCANASNRANGTKNLDQPFMNETLVSTGTQTHHQYIIVK